MAMTGWQYHPLWDSTGYEGLPPHRQPRWLVVLQLLLVAVILGGGLLLARWLDISPATLDRTNPTAVADAFVRSYTAGDPAACTLAASALRTTLEREQRCIGQPEQPRGPAAVAWLYSTTCGDRHGAAATVTAAGRRRTALAVSLRRASTEWHVVAVAAVDDRSVLRPYRCDPGAPP